MDELEIRMREVLLQLAMVSNGRTASWAPSGGGESDAIPTLGQDDAPHLHFARRWDAARDQPERERILQQAQERLKHERRSSGDRTKVESKAERDARIVDRCEGLTAQEAAIWARCGVTDVRKAREAAGRETEKGYRPRNGHELDPEARQAEIRRLADDEHMPARQIAQHLELSYSTVLRELGTKT